MIADQVAGPEDAQRRRIAEIGEAPPPGAHGVMVRNVPDYGTTEAADHALALALSLRLPQSSSADS